MATHIILLGIITLINFSNIGFSFEVPLQDFCVADFNSSVRVNGLACKNPASVTPNDFFFSGLHLPGNTTNPDGTAISPVTVVQMPGLNTLGISIARLDFAPKGVLPPHTHPRATEILTVLEGSLQVGFVTTNPTYRHISKVLNKGDVFVVPIGLVHYQFNAGEGNTVAIAALNSQNPGIVAVTNAVFGATPDLDADYLAKAFHVERSVVDEILAKF